MPKQYNLKYFESIKSLPMKRYALWLMESPGYGFSIFNGMDKALKNADDSSLSGYYDAYPQESEWFTKHLEKHPDALEIQKHLFNIHN
ncbi:MAG TPA: hypothetical protein PKE39_04370 [Ignavibacteria bacterium]|nr:hypothetical protein [Ignavibacteria bacterium]HMQ98237.1 hypothetical protein [Ignavibacteria bacterium]